MRAIFLVFLWTASAFAQNVQQQPPPPEVKPEDKCSVEGTILNGATGGPLGKASVLLRGSEPSTFAPASYSARTNSEGHYAITNIDPGKYVLTVQKNGFVTTSYGVKGGGRMASGTVLNLSARATMKNIDVPLTAQGVVIGRVVDEDGEPIPNVQVRAMRMMYQNGRRSLMTASGSSTNDKGEYRMFGVPPGRYYISALYRETTFYPATEIRSDTDGDYAPVFYPATTSAQNALQVDVPAGHEVSGIDLRLTRMKLPRVSGTVAGTGRAYPTSVMLMARDGGPVSYEGMKNTVVDGQGRFTFRGVLPGRYSITALSPTGGQDRLIASAMVDVTTQNVENVQLAFGPPTIVAGILQVEGRQDLGDLKGTGLRLSLQPMDGGPMFGSNSALIKEDGAFEVRNIAPERYRIGFYPPSDNYYVKAARIGNTEVSEPIIDLTAAVPSEITITLSSRAAQVQGVVNAERDKPAPGATVALIPDDREKTYLYKTGSTDQDGRFALKGIPPGRYKLFAWESLDFGSWQDPEFLKPFEDGGVALLLSEGAQENKELKLLHLASN